MIRHYLKIAWRNLQRQKVLTLINISGLSIGLACFSLFLLYAVNEFSYDRFHAKAENIYRVYDWWDYSDRQGSEPSSAMPLGPAMKQDFPDVKDFVRIGAGGNKMVRIGNSVQQINMTFADPQIFSVFTFPLISGNIKSALETEKSVVLTKEKAEQLFGTANAVGKRIEIKTGDKFEEFEVGAVAENIPANSTIHFDMLGNLKYVLNTDEGKASINNWNMTLGISVYVQLMENSKLMHESEKLASFRYKYFPNEQQAEKSISGENKPIKPTNGFGLQPLTDIHTNTKIDKWGAANPKNIWILISIAIGILLIACVNFVTLAVSRSANRSREIGIRKVTGSNKVQLVYQFLTESFLTSIISAIFGLLLANLLLPFFNQLAGKSLSFSFIRYPEIPVLLIVVIILTGLLSGLYPAMVISGFKPVDVLKNKLRFSGSNFFTKSLVSFQFVLSIGLIISTITIFKQLSFLQTKNLGFDKENVVMINTLGIDIKKNYPFFRQTLTSDSHIMGVSTSYIGLGSGEGQMGRRYIFDDKEESVIEYPVDPDFLNVMDIKLVAGRNFNREIASDSVNSVIVNEALVQKVWGIEPEAAVGKEFKGKGENAGKTIIGVSKNINFEDLTRTIRPQMFLNTANFKPNVIFVRISPGDPSTALALLNKAWRTLSPDFPFHFNFVDQKFDDFYKSEQRWANIIIWAGGISIFLACMGLIGLISLAVVNRSIEIGIRKVNGARISEVIAMLNSDFVKWVAIAFVIATPIAYYAMNKWLETFAYKTELSWWIFALAGLLALGIALLTVSWQSWKAATRNPVEALRYE
jgi:putative ABC transport system permease protein